MPQALVVYGTLVRCQHCGKAIDGDVIGKNRRYCGASCKQRAYEARHPDKFPPKPERVARPKPADIDDTPDGTCHWCHEALEPDARKDAIYHRRPKSCRQQAYQARVEKRWERKVISATEAGIRAAAREARMVKALSDPVIVEALVPKVADAAIRAVGAQAAHLSITRE